MAEEIKKTINGIDPSKGRYVPFFRNKQGKRMREQEEIETISEKMRKAGKSEKEIEEAIERMKSGDIDINMTGKDGKKTKIEKGKIIN
jgi:DNA polymerase II large subunit